MLWMIGGIIVFVLFSVLLSRIYIKCNLTYHRSQQTVILSIFVYRIRLYKKKMNLVYSMNPGEWDMLKELSMLESNVKKKIQKAKHDYAYIIALLHVIRLHQLKWHTRVGTGKAHTTGITVGLTWTIKGLIIGSMSNLCELSKQPYVSVVPNYQKLGFESHMDCILSIKIGHAIYAFFKIMQNNIGKKKAYS